MEEISIKKAAIINFIARYINVFIQLIYNIILARILMPEEFGVVAVITVFTTFFMLLANMGIGSAVIQIKSLDTNDINNIFSLTFFLGIMLAVIFICLSVPISVFYKNEAYILIGSLLSISILFNTMNMVPNAILLKNKRFKMIAIRIASVSLFSATISILGAIIGFSYYAILINSILAAILTFIWNFRTVRPQLIFKIDMKCIKKIQSFSLYQFAFSIVNYFARNFDNLLIGKFIGETALGYYDRSYKLMQYPTINLTHAITPILHPILSDYQENKDIIFDKYSKVVKLLSLLGLFISAFCFFTAEEIIIIIFGEQWIPSIPSFKFLALSVWAQMITSSSGSIFQSLGNTKLLFKVGLINAVLTVIAIIVGLSYNNIEKVAMFVTIAYNTHFIITFIILMKFGFKYKYSKFIKIILPHLIIFVLISIGLYLFSQFVSVENMYLSLLLKAGVGLGLYVIGLLTTMEYKFFLNLIKKRR